MTVKFRLGLAAALFTLVAIPSYADLLAGEETPTPGDFVFSFDENGDGCFGVGCTLVAGAGTLAADPTLAGNPDSLIFQLGAFGPVGAGDVRVYEDTIGGTIGDVLRFTNAAGDLTGTGATEMIFYSTAGGGSLADTGIPGTLDPNDGGGVLEVNGAFTYAGGAGANTYDGISDVPEPVSVADQAGSSAE